MPTASVATTVTLCTPDVFSAVIVPTYVSLATNVSGSLLAVTLATPDASVALTVTVINPVNSTSVRLSSTEFISGSVVSTSYVFELSSATLSNSSVATTVTLCTPAALSAFITPFQVPLSSASSSPLAVTLATPDASVARTATLIDPSGEITVGASTTDVITGGVASTSYVFVLFSATLPATSVATTVTLYVPDVLSAVIVPSHVPLSNVSATSLAVTLATPDASVAMTATPIDSSGPTVVRASTTEVITGAVSSTSYVLELSSATLANSSVATTVTLCTPDMLSAGIVPSQISVTSVSSSPLAVTLATPDASVAITATLINPFGATTVGLSSTEVISGGVASTSYVFVVCSAAF